MQFIRQIYNRFFKKYDKIKEEIDPNIIFSVDIDDDYHRHISIYIPDDIDMDRIIDLAKAYVDTLIDFSSPRTVQELLQSLENAIDQENPSEVLLFENILSLFVQYSNLRSDPSDPMVNPLAVFSSK